MEKNEVKIIRILNAPLEKVWDAWVNHENLKQWKAPVGMTTPDAKVDLKTGGSYFVSMQGGHAGEGVLTVRGVYKTIEKFKKLAFTWKWDGQSEETLVTVLFKAISKNKTKLTLIHNGFETSGSYREHNIGWKSTFNKLEKFVD